MRLHLVGRERLAEDLVDERRDALDVIGVEDVRVLVRDELEVPVVDVAERRHVVGRGDVQSRIASYGSAVAEPFALSV